MKRHLLHRRTWNGFGREVRSDSISLVIPNEPKPVVRLLRVEAPHFVAGALWERIGQHRWLCYEAAPVLRFMVGMNARRAELYLKWKGWTYQWRL